MSTPIIVSMNTPTIVSVALNSGIFVGLQLFASVIMAIILLITLIWYIKEGIGWEKRRKDFNRRFGIRDINDI